MNNNKDYITKSIRERILLKQFQTIQNDFTVDHTTPYDGYDNYDCIITSGNTSYICEIKVRLYPLTSYTGWIIEQQKYNHLINQQQHIPLYITIHQDGIQIWNLHTATQPIWNNNPLPQNNHSNNTVNKANGDLSQTEAAIYKNHYNIIKATEKAERLFYKHFAK